MALAIVICDSSSIASSQLTLPHGHPAFPTRPHFTLGEQQLPRHYPTPHQEGGSMRRVWEHTRELEREKMSWCYLFIV